MSAIVNPRTLLMQAAPTRIDLVSLPANVSIPALAALAPDATVPPTPTGFAVGAAISNLIISHANPTFTVGHGYLRTNVYGSVWMGGALPVFADAQRITSFSGAVAAHPTNPATSWRLWITWVSRDGVESAPAGGTNGLAARTGEDVERLVAALTGPGNPFVVLSVDTVIGGVTYPAGTYSARALIFEAQIGNAQIKNLAIDDAKVVSLSAAKLTAGSLRVGSYISSSNYVDGVSGFAIWADGNAAFNNVTMRGGVYATYGLIGGNQIASNGIFSPNYVPGVSGWGMDSAGAAQFNNIALRGSIAGGAFTGWSFPASGGGFYLGSQGLLLGNYNTGPGYVQIEANGNILTPAFDVTAGVMTLKQLNVVNTANIAGGAISSMRILSGDAASLPTSVWVPANQTMTIAAVIRTAGTPAYLYVDGVEVAVAEGIAGTTTSPPVPGMSMGLAAAAGGAGGRSVAISLTDGSGANAKQAIIFGTLK